MMNDNMEQKKSSEFISELEAGSQKTLGERIRIIWQQSGKTQGELSKLLGITSVTLSNYMKGIRRPDSKIVAKFSEKPLNICLEWLMHGTGPMYITEQKISSHLVLTDTGKEALYCMVIESNQKTITSQEREIETLKGQILELKAENAGLKARLSLFASSSGENHHANTA